MITPASLSFIVARSHNFQGIELDSTTPKSGLTIMIKLYTNESTYLHLEVASGIEPEKVSEVVR